MRTAVEILTLYQKMRDDGKDFFGFVGEVMIRYLPFDLAKPFLKDSVQETDWHPHGLTDEAVLKEMSDYMTFAWGKVENHRGLSAGRSIEKMSAWLRVLGNDELADKLDSGDPWGQYGAGLLAIVCEKYKFPIPAGEAIQNMIQGMPCRPGCRDGCSAHAVCSQEAK